MKILISGVNGLLGQHLADLLMRENFTVIGMGKGACRLSFSPDGRFRYYTADIRYEYEVHDIFLQEQPDVVVHAAAMTQVDECELNPALCEETNVNGTAHLLTNSELFSGHFIYVSTDFVFDGATGMYAEEDDLNPVNFYGFTKMQAESLAATSEIPFAIIRTCLVYGRALSGSRSNIITWVKDNLQAGKNIKVVNDQWRTPTYVKDLAKGILLVIRQKSKGIFHLSGAEKMTPFMMANTVADYFKFDKTLIEEVTAATFSQPARRPPKTGFVIDKAKSLLGYQPCTFQEGLADTFAGSIS